MIHRNLNHESLTLAAIDDIILRGKLVDWTVLRDAAKKDRIIMEKIQHICSRFLADPYAQRYHFWNNYVEKYLT